MKKILSVFVFFIFISNYNFCTADPYKDDNNYKFVATGSSGIFYLNLKSIDIQEYNPPYYKIAGDFIHVYFSSNGEKISVQHVVKRYDWGKKISYHLNEYGTWIADKVNDKLNPEDDSDSVKRARKFADALFLAAYGINFYGY